MSLLEDLEKNNEGVYLMNINDFEADFDDKILARGSDYYRSGSVLTLEYDGEEWVADVEGSEDYTVTVMLADNGEILDSTCDCPYYWGQYCKHQAAVFYALQKELRSGKTPAKAGKKKKLEDILKTLDKQALLTIILEFANRDKRIKEELLLRYAEKEDIEKSARGVIQSAINAAERGGFVEYNDTRRALAGADTVLQMIDDQIESGDIFKAISLSIIVLEEMLNLYDYCDDSDGHLSSTIDEAIEKIDTALDDSLDLEDKDSRRIFEIIFNRALDSLYNNWTDWRVDLLYTTTPLCGNRANRDKIEQYISEWKSTKTSSWSSIYESRKLQKLQLSIIKMYDGKPAAEAYMEEHLENSDFRDTMIQNAISGGQYAKALNLCLEGEQKDSDHAGLVNKWKQYRYEIYEKTEDARAQKCLALEFALKGDFEYFKKLKALYTQDEWPVILQDVLEKTASKSSGVYVEILIHENLKSLLLEYCKINTRAIVANYPHLLPEYKNDIGVIFVKYITESAVHADNRSRYRDVCGIIKHYKKACGSSAADELRDQLSAKHAKRPAFLDELRKI